MENLLIVFLALSLMVNAFLLGMLRTGAKTMQNATELIKGWHASSTYWKLLAMRFESLVHAKEITKMVFEGIDVVPEHPDPAEQAQANKMITNLKRLAEKVKLANSLQTKGSDETN